MIRVDRFRARDLAGLRVQPAQRRDVVDYAAQGPFWEQAGRCFTVRLVAGGEPLFCGGAVASHADYATLWSVIGEDAGRHMLAITRRTAQFVAALPFRRIDAFVRSDDRAGHRWIHTLGFRVEARLDDLFADGGDAVIYRKAG
jgi:hypothetical protein